MLAVFPSYAEHSLPALLDAGVPCSLNGDDPLLFGPDLLGEYELVRKEFGFDDERIATMARASIEFSGARDEVKDATASPASPPGSTPTSSDPPPRRWLTWCGRPKQVSHLSRSGQAGSGVVRRSFIHCGARVARPSASTTPCTVAARAQTSSSTVSR